LVFDAFVALIPQAEVVVAWPDIELAADEVQAMGIVLSRLGYLGRAESWCSARIIDDWRSAPGSLCGWIDAETGECSEFTDTESGESVRVLVPETRPQIEESLLWNAWAYDGKAARPDPRWNLLAETADLHREGWSDPPGARWLMYVRSRDSLAVEPAPRSDRARARPTVVRYAIDGSVLPSVAQTVYLAEIARRYVQGIHGKRNAGASAPVFNGKAADGRPLDGHAHAFWLPSDEDGDGRLDHLTVFASCGFDPDAELLSLDRLRWMHGPGGTGLGLLLLGVGRPADFEEGQPLVASRSWRSATPFVPTRHAKARGKKRDTGGDDGFLVASLREELERHGLPMPVAIRRVPRLSLRSGRSMSWLQFRRERLRGGGRRGTHPGAGFEIEFAEPVRGPLALGYACHFGLGLFMPVGG